MTGPSSRVRTQAGIFGERAGLFAFTGPFPVALTASGTCVPWTPPPGASRLLDGAGVASTPHVPQDTEQQSTDQGRQRGRGQERRGRRGQGWGRRSGRSWGTERAASPTPHVDAGGEGGPGLPSPTSQICSFVTRRVRCAGRTTGGTGPRGHRARRALAVCAAAALVPRVSPFSFVLSATFRGQSCYC